MDIYQVSNVLLPGVEDGVAESAAVVVVGSEILEMDLEQVVVLADLAASNASHPADARIGRLFFWRPRPLGLDQSAFGLPFARGRMFPDVGLQSLKSVVVDVISICEKV